MPDIIADKYEVLETIGRGGMGTVYKARQINLDRIVAIKMLSEELASDPEFRARFQQEATVVARLNHPNIVQVHDIEPHKNTFCIIMEFVDGENLQAKIDRDVTLPESEAMGIGAQVARALAYAHTRGIVHRDIKPDNIHVTPKGVAKVMDFGIARLVDSKLKTQTGISMGTPKFMSPEQVTGKNVDGQTDLYSLGICLYYCLSGRPPFDGENAISVATRHLYEQPEPPSKLNPSISPAVEQAILKALEKQKPNRYKTGTEMAEALETAVGLKSVDRATPDGDSPGGPTIKMAAQTFGATTPLHNSRSIASSPVTPGGVVPPANPSSPNVYATPHSSAVTVPELDASFRTPGGGHGTESSTRSFRFSLFVFAGLVGVAVILLIVLVVWLRQSDAALGNPSGTNAAPVQNGERVRALTMETDRLLKENRPADARQALIAFQKQHPGLETNRISTQIQAIEGQLPLSEAPVLAERRYREAFTALENKERALAFAYLKGALDLGLPPALAHSGTTTITLQNLERKLSEPPSAAASASAEEARKEAESLMAERKSQDLAYKRLVQAVETDYRNPLNWQTLGNFFLSNNNIDGARVMYREASNLTKDVTLRSKIDEKLASISR